MNFGAAAERARVDTMTAAVTAGADHQQWNKMEKAVIRTEARGGHMALHPQQQVWEQITMRADAGWRHFKDGLSRLAPLHRLMSGCQIPVSIDSPSAAIHVSHVHVLSSVGAWIT